MKKKGTRKTHYHTSYYDRTIGSRSKFKAGLPTEYRSPRFDFITRVFLFAYIFLWKMNPYSLHALPFSPHYLRNLVILCENHARGIYFWKKRTERKEENSIHFCVLLSRMQDFFNPVLYWLKIAHARAWFVQSLVIKLLVKEIEERKMEKARLDTRIWEINI